jgi:hypothetical protein
MKRKKQSSKRDRFEVRQLPGNAMVASSNSLVDALALAREWKYETGLGYWVGDRSGMLLPINLPQNSPPVRRLRHR